MDADMIGKGSNRQYLMLQEAIRKKRRVEYQLLSRRTPELVMNYMVHSAHIKDLQKALSING